MMIVGSLRLIRKQAREPVFLGSNLVQGPLGMFTARLRSSNRVVRDGATRRATLRFAFPSDPPFIIFVGLMVVMVIVGPYLPNGL